MFFSFAGGGYSACPGVALDYFPGMWVGELHMVHDAHLLILQFHVGSFGDGWRRELVMVFSVRCA
jgi:hypothetical protein